jgi:predicted metal-dependent hydrolase
VDFGTLTFGDTRIRYRLRRSQRKKTISIAVDPVEGVVVTAPDDADQALIRDVVAKKARWIAERHRETCELATMLYHPQFVSGESFPYLGRNYRLRVIPGAGAATLVRLLRGWFEITVDAGLSAPQRGEAVRFGLRRWYQEHAAARLADRAANLALRLGIAPPPLLIRDQRKRWASCDRHGSLRFNWRIIMAPMSLVDYVVAHELCHLIQHDHSAAFWKLLRTVMPDYHDRRERLRREGPRFQFW